MRYRKKPVVIEAWHNVEGAVRPDWLQSPGVAFAGDAVIISTLEGVQKANAGDWIIRGVKGELYPCRADIFEATYEPV
jgi:hypothetical protein